MNVERQSEVLVLGGPRTRVCEDVRAAVERAGATPVVAGDVGEALTMLAGNPDERAVILDARTPAFEEVLRVLREEPRLYGIPALVMVSEPSTAAFVRAHALGADGVIVTGRWGELTACLVRLLGSVRPERVPIVHGNVLVGHHDVTVRRGLARGFRRLGFGVCFAADWSELDRLATAEDTRALVVASQMVMGLPSVLERDLPALVLAPALDVERLQSVVRGAPDVRIVPSKSSAEALVFQLGELLRPSILDARSSRRLLTSTLCCFRKAGSQRVRHGLTHNISMDGMFIRAVAPPEPGTVLWVELAPPGRDRMVHLRGEVMWRRGPTPTPGGGPAPPGFGVRILPDACPKADLEAYRQAYRDLAAQASSPPRSTADAA